jgi:hypothetical protein
MQEIKVYVSAENPIGSVRDYANSRGLAAPPLVRDVEIMLKFRLFSSNGSLDPYPIEQLKTVSAWRFVMDRDFDSNTSSIIVADNERITVELVSEVIDGVEYQYSQIAVPISNTNTQELSEWLGKNKQQNGLTAELSGYDSNGNTAFVLQIENFSVRNRLTATGAPTELESDYWTEAQVRAFAAAEIDRAVKLQALKMLPEISVNDTWIINGVDTGKSTNGKKGDKGDRGAAFKIDATGTLAERTQYDAETKDFAYLATDNGNVYIKASDTSGDWSDPIPFKGEKGDKAFNLRGEWTADTEYAVDDAVTHNGSFYIAVMLTISEPGTDSSWQMYVSKGDKGEKGEVGAPAPNTRVQYSVDGVTWSDSPSVNLESRYIRFSTDNGATWGDRIKFVGRDGIDAQPLLIRYSADGINWYGNPENASPTNFIMFSTDGGGTWTKSMKLKGDTGEKGTPGYTPERGVDYWTDEDKETIKAYVDEAILNGEW